MKNIRYVAIIDTAKIESYMEDCVPVKKLLDEITSDELTFYVRHGVEESFTRVGEDWCDIFDNCRDDYVSQISSLDSDSETLVNSEVATIIGMVGSEAFSDAVTLLAELKLSNKIAIVDDCRLLGRSKNQLHFLLNIAHE